MTVLVHQSFTNPIVLKDLSDFFIRSFGPKGGIKAIVSSVGGLTITNSSHRILRSTNFENSGQVDAILQTMQGFLEQHQDGGLYFGSLLSEMILIWSQESINEETQKKIMTTLEKRRKKIDFENCSDMLSITGSILGSKPWIPESERQSLNLTMVQSFLQGLTNQFSIDRRSILIKVNLGKTFQSFRQAGLLHRYPDLDHDQPFPFELQDCKVLALNLQLTGRAKDVEELIKFGNLFASIKNETWIEDELLCLCQDVGVKLVVNQKQVSQSCQRRFRSQGICILERFGKKDIESLCYLSGSKLISTSRLFDAKEAKDATGFLTNVEKIEYQDKCYLQFSSERVVMSTIVVEAWNEEVVDEVKVVCDQAINSLFNCLASPFILPGGGCLEASLILALLGQDKTRLQGQCIDLLSKLAKNYTKSDDGSLISKSTGHLFRYSRDADEISQTCSCGQYLRPNIDDTMDGDFIDLSSSSSLANLQSRNSAIFEEKSMKIVDLYCLRQSQYELAMEMAMSIGNIGVVIEVE